MISQVTSPASKKYVNFCLWNAQSIKNKTACFSDYLCEKKIDLAALTETWFNNFDSAVKAECLPDGYKFNIHIDDESDPYSSALTDLLQSMALKQHVCIPTQHHGHTLDLIITRD